MAGKEVKYSLKMDASGFTAAAREAKSQFDGLTNGLASSAGRFGEIAKAAGPAGLAIAAIGGAAVVAGGQVVAFLSGATKQAIELGSTLQTMSTRTATSAEGIQRLAANGKASFDQITTSIEAARKQLDKAPEGFKALGLSISELKKMDGEKLLLAISDRVKELPPGFQQSSAAVALLGKAGAASLPFLVSDLRGAGEQAERFGRILSDQAVAALDTLGDQVGDAGKNWQSFQDQLGAAIGSSPALLQAVKDITAGLGQMARWVQDNRDFITEMTDRVVAGTRALLEYAGVMGAIRGAPQVLGMARSGASMLGLGSGGTGNSIGPSSARLIPSRTFDPGGDTAAAKARAEWERAVATYRAANTELGRAEVNIRKINVALEGMGDVSRISAQEMFTHLRALGTFGEEGRAAAEIMREEWERTHGVFLLFRRDISALRPPGAGETGQRGPTAALTPVPFHFDPDAPRQTPEERARNIQRTTALIQDLSAALGELGAAFFGINTAAGQFLSMLSDMLGLIARARQGDYIGAGTGALTGAFRRGQDIGASGGSRGRAGGMGALQGAAVGAAIGTALIPIPVLGTVAGATVGAIAGAISGLRGHARGAAAALKEMNRELKDARSVLEDIRVAGNAAAAQLKAMRAGIEIEGLDDLVNSLTDKVVSGTNRLLENFAPTTEQDARALGALFSASFWAVVRQRGIIGASDAFRESFHRLMEQYAALGISAEGSPLGQIGFLLDLGADEKFRALAEAAQGAAEMLEGLAGLGFVDQSVLGGSADMIMRLFQGLMERARAGGGTESESFRASFTTIMNLLNTYLDQTRRSGGTVDPRIEGLLREALGHNIRPLTSVAEHQLQTQRDILAAVLGINRTPRPGPAGEPDPNGPPGNPDNPDDMRRGGGGRDRGLAEGGWVAPTVGGQIIRVAEGGEGESIVPDSERLAFAQGVLGSGAGQSYTLTIENRPTVSVNFQGSRADIEPFMDRSMPEIARAFKRNTGGMRKVLVDAIDDRLRQRRLI